MQMKVPRVVSVTPTRLLLKAPSKSTKLPRLVEYLKTSKGIEKKDCSCPGTYWFRVKGQADKKMCRHHKMTTVHESTNSTPYKDLMGAIDTVKNRSRALYVVMADIRCQHPEHRGVVHCDECPLYPETCNVHKIVYDKNGRKRVPQVWKLQTAIYNGRRKDAKRILVQILKNVRRTRKQ